MPMRSPATPPARGASSSRCAGRRPTLRTLLLVRAGARRPWRARSGTPLSRARVRGALDRAGLSPDRSPARAAAGRPSISRLGTTARRGVGTPSSGAARSHVEVCHTPPSPASSPHTLRQAWRPPYLDLGFEGGHYSPRASMTSRTRRFATVNALLARRRRGAAARRRRRIGLLANA